MVSACAGRFNADSAGCKQDADVVEFYYPEEIVECDFIEAERAAYTTLTSRFLPWQMRPNPGWMPEMSYSTLVDVATLKANLANPDWRIVDVRHLLADVTHGERAYAESHLPGAVFPAL